MRTRNAWVLSCLTVFALASAPLLAHGWAPPGPPPPPPGYNPAGGGTGQGAAQPPAGGGAEAGPYTGPTGGGDATAPGLATSGGSNAGGNEAGSSAPSARPVPGTLLPSTSARGSATVGSKPKNVAPWMDRIHVPWTVGFLPAVGATGYGTRLGTVSDALKLPVPQGGWDRDSRAVIVLTYDAADADHRRVLESLDSDGRVRAAAQFFSCFRVDVGAKAKKSEATDAHLSVYTSDGSLIGSLSGRRRITGVYDLLASAWAKKGGTDFGERVSKMEAVLKHKAYAEHYLPVFEGNIVCPDCGEERHDVVERIADLKFRAEACDRAMADLRIVTRN
jgi:hypothetical protein